MKKSKLPRVPSKLIRLALQDLAKVERSKKYQVNMNTWHNPIGDNVCSVCLAGAIIAKTLKFKPTEHVSPDLITLIEGGITLPVALEDSTALMALDSFRKGNIRGGLDILRLFPKGFRFRAHMYVSTYDSDPEGFKRDMAEMAKYLESKGF